MVGATSVFVSFQSIAEESSGAGVVIITSIMRSKMEKDSSSPFKCPALFHDPLDLYSLDLPRHPKIPFNKTRVMTKVASDKSCTTEKVEGLLARHSCLKSSLDRAMKQAEDLVEKWQESYLHLVREDNYLGNIDPEEINYRLIVRSTDKNVNYIDVYAWDFSWLSDFNFFSNKNACPYTFHLQQDWSSKTGATTLIQSTPLDPSI